MTENDQIVEMALNRTAPMMIAYKLQCEVGKVYSAIRQARRNGIDIPPFGRGRHRKDPVLVPLAQQVVVPIRLHRWLTQEAERREMTVQELGQHFIESGLLKSGEAPAIETTNGADQ